MKKQYEKPKMEIIQFEISDIISTSANVPVDPVLNLDNTGNVIPE